MLEVDVLGPRDNLKDVISLHDELKRPTDLFAHSSGLSRGIVRHGFSLFGDLRWFVFRQQGEPVAVVPLEVSVEDDGPFPLRSLRSLSRFQLSYGDLLFRPAVSVGEIWTSLCQVRPFSGKCADVVRLRDMRIGSGLFDLARSLHAHHLRPSDGSSVLETKASRDEWLAGVTKNLRGQVRQSFRRLNEIGEIDVRVSDKEPDLGQAFDRFVDLESRGYKAQLNPLQREIADRSVFSEIWSEPYEKWERPLVIELWLDAELAASQLAIRLNNVLYLLKIAYNEQFSSCSPGTWLMSELLSGEIVDGLESIDCCVRQSWHQRWSPRVEPTFLANIPTGRTLRAWGLRIGYSVRQHLRR